MTFTAFAQNNPVMRVAAWMIHEDAEARNDPAVAARLGLVSKKKRQISNRWNKAWMMYKNPKIAVYSSSGEEGLKLKEIQKALKEIDKEKKEEAKQAKKRLGLPNEYAGSSPNNRSDYKLKLQADV